MVTCEQFTGFMALEDRNKELVAKVAELREGNEYTLVRELKADVERLTRSLRIAKCCENENCTKLDCPLLLQPTRNAAGNLLL